MPSTKSKKATPVRSRGRAARSRPSSVSSAGSVRSHSGRSRRSRTPAAPRASIFDYLAKPHHQALRKALRARRADEKRGQRRLTKKALPSDATNQMPSSPSGSQSSGSFSHLSTSSASRQSSRSASMMATASDRSPSGGSSFFVAHSLRPNVALLNKPYFGPSRRTKRSRSNVKHASSRSRTRSTRRRSASASVITAASDRFPSNGSFFVPHSLRANVALLNKPYFGSSRRTKRSRSDVKRAGHTSRSRSRSTRGHSASVSSHSNKKRVAKRGRSTSSQQAGRVLKSARSGRGRSKSTSTRRAARVVKSARSRKDGKAKSPKSAPKSEKRRLAAGC